MNQLADISSRYYKGPNATIDQVYSPESEKMMNDMTKCEKRRTSVGMKQFLPRVSIWKIQLFHFYHFFLEVSSDSCEKNVPEKVTEHY